ncbi:hypothetical protein TNCV_1674891 [Trichonephila clavipes]|nr:hypothetical protein TNCV_1674891 [Trichonephila clavipes]
MLNSVLTNEKDEMFEYNAIKRRNLKLLYDHDETIAAYALVKLQKSGRFGNNSPASNSATNAVSMRNGERNESGEDSLNCTSEGHDRVQM